MENELISKKSELEKQLQTLQLKKTTLNELDTELNINIMKLQTEIKILDDRIKGIRAQKKSNDLANVREILGVSFDKNNYTLGENGKELQMISKTSVQLQMEYMSLLNKLNEKLDNNEINDEQYDLVYNSLLSLYNQYKEDLSSEKTQSNLKSQSMGTSYQEPMQYSQPESVDKIDEFEERLRKKYGYYDRSLQEQEEIDKIIHQEIYQGNYQENEQLENTGRKIR